MKKNEALILKIVICLTKIGWIELELQHKNLPPKGVSGPLQIIYCRFCNLCPRNLIRIFSIQRKCSLRRKVNKNQLQRLVARALKNIIQFLYVKSYKFWIFLICYTSSLTKYVHIIELQKGVAEVLKIILCHICSRSPTLAAILYMRCKCSHTMKFNINQLHREYERHKYNTLYIGLYSIVSWCDNSSFAVDVQLWCSFK